MNKIIENTLIGIALVAATIGVVSLYYMVWGDPILGGRIFASAVITFLVAAFIANNI